MADDERCLDVAGLAVLLAGGLRETGDSVGAVRAGGRGGCGGRQAAEYLNDVQACGRSDATLRSYGMGLLRLVPEQAWQIAIDGRGEVRERRAGEACADSSCAHRTAGAGWKKRTSPS